MEFPGFSGDPFEAGLMSRFELLRTHVAEIASRRLDSTLEILQKLNIAAYAQAVGLGGGGRPCYTTNRAKGTLDSWTCESGPSRPPQRVRNGTGLRAGEYHLGATLYRSSDRQRLADQPVLPSEELDTADASQQEIPNDEHLVEADRNQDASCTTRLEPIPRGPFSCLV